MPLKIPNEGEAWLLDRFTDYIVNGLGQEATLYLFSNDLTPDENTVLGDCTDSGLDGQALTGPVVTPDGDAGGRAVCDFDLQEWVSPAGTITVYGYWVQENPSPAGFKLLWAERFSSPIDLVYGGVPLHITPQLKFSTEN